MERMAERGQIPTLINRSRTVTIYKKGSYRDPGNYRLISIQNSIVKIYEKFLYFKYKDKVIRNLQSFQRGSIEGNRTLDIVRKTLEKA